MKDAADERALFGHLSFLLDHRREGEDLVLPPTASLHVRGFAKAPQALAGLAHEATDHVLRSGVRREIVGRGEEVALHGLRVLDAKLVEQRLFSRGTDEISSGADLGRLGALGDLKQVQAFRDAQLLDLAASAAGQSATELRGAEAWSEQVGPGLDLARKGQIPAEQRGALHQASGVQALDQLSALLVGVHLEAHGAGRVAAAVRPHHERAQGQ